MNNHEILVGVREFILGGDASFTIHQESNNGKESHAVKYRVLKNDNGTCWFVHTELSDGSDMYTSGSKLVYQGYLKRDLTFNVGKKGVVDFNKSAIKALIWVLQNSNNIPKIVHIYHHGKCSKCGRKLTDAESLRCGLGPTCRKKVGL